MGHNIKECDPTRGFYQKIEDHPYYPKNFEKEKTMPDLITPVKNLEALQDMLEYGTGWKKVIRYGWDGSEDVSLHFFRSIEGRIYTFKDYSGWSVY